MINLRMSSALVVAAIACSTVTHTHGVTFGKIVKVAGDRQIVVGPFNAPMAPFAIKVLDSSGDPYPSLGVVIQNTVGGGPACARNLDEFGLAGFHASTDFAGCGGNLSNAALTDANGGAVLQPSVPNAVPSAFLVGAGVQLGDQQGVPDIARYQYFSIVRAVNVPPGQPQVVVEYFHDGYRNYFNTIVQAEIDALDAGVFSGWQREVGSFIAWPTQSAAPVGAVSVCRFFASAFASHFYTADPAECDAVLAKFPDWQLETREAFWIVLPDQATGACPGGYQPVYRVLKPTNPNHRYVTDRVVRDTMVAGGWVAEGYGPDASIMCTPR